MSSKKISRRVKSPRWRWFLYGVLWFRRTILCNCRCATVLTEAQIENDEWVSLRDIIAWSPHLPLELTHSMSDFRCSKLVERSWWRLTKRLNEKEEGGRGWRHRLGIRVLRPQVARITLALYSQSRDCLFLPCQHPHDIHVMYWRWSRAHLFSAEMEKWLLLL